MHALSRVTMSLWFAAIAILSPVAGITRSLAAIGPEVGGRSPQNSPAESPPREWIEPTTGHRVSRLSDEPGSASLYFHQNQYTSSGDKMVFSTREGLSTINLKTRKIEALVAGPVGKVIVGRKSRQVFYMRGDTVLATDLDSKATRTIATRPELRSASGFAVNADETLLAGSYAEGQTNRPPTPPPAEPNLIPPSQESSLEARWLARRPMRLFANTATEVLDFGEIGSGWPGTTVTF